MSFERDHSHAHTSTHAADHDDERAPGRGSCTAELTAPSNPVVSGLLRRKAHDADGVAEGADTAVAAASSSSGFALPGPLMRKFESSLGADLSSVRIHTGAESASAARAVGAKAYTVGQDIHFGAGHYDPSSAAGQHLLAHEVAHTVQQRGAASPPQYKLEVSSPHDAAEHEADRAADAMMTGAPATVSSASGIALHRAEEKQPTPYPGATPPTSPFDLGSLPPATQAEIERLALDALRPLVLAEVNRAYTDFTEACMNAITILDKEKDARQKSEQAFVDIAIGVGGFLLGPAFAAGGAAMSARAPKLRSTLDSSIAEKLPGALHAAGVHAAKAAEVRAVAADLAKNVMAKATPEAASSALGWIAKAGAAQVVKVNLDGSNEDKAISYLQAIRRSANAQIAQLNLAIATSHDAGQLLGIHSQFVGATELVYRAQLDRQAHDFVKQIASSVGASAKNTIVIINAYGKDRLASVHAGSDSGRFVFLSWITPNMESVARQLKPNPRRITPANVDGHLPDPVNEGAYRGRELVRQVNAWGKLRLVVVKTEEDSIFNVKSDHSLHFVKWVASDPESEAIARQQAAAQAGGLLEIDPARIKDLRPPPAEDPLPTAAAPEEPGPESYL